MGANAYRRFSEPNDPVFWIDQLPAEAFAEGFGLQALRPARARAKAPKDQKHRCSRWEMTDTARLEAQDGPFSSNGGGEGSYRERMSALCRRRW